MKKRYSKYRILKRFNTKSKAELHRDNLIKIRTFLGETKDITVVERKFVGKDKKRFYVRELVIQGVK
mgnify:CR=1 FL=1|tara:strand:+ start:192 stop:392 length:201 start_codon:yes stop_codon:yes gene_type:complete